MPMEAILNLDIYQSTRLKQGIDLEVVKVIFDVYNKCLMYAMKRCDGVIW